jgi:hypothetical protein
VWARGELAQYGLGAVYQHLEIVDIQDVVARDAQKRAWRAMCSLRGDVVRQICASTGRGRAW